MVRFCFLHDPVDSVRSFFLWFWYRFNGGPRDQNTMDLENLFALLLISIEVKFFRGTLAVGRPSGQVILYIY